MPQLVNGIGTWYHGKQNLLQVTGQCEFCGKIAALSSYDTGLYFVIFLIPIIPLGKKHVFNECAACKRHKVMPLEKWRELKQQACTEAREAYMKTPMEADAARKAIATALGYQEPTLLVELAAEMVGRFTGEPEVLGRIAEGYSYFGKYREAEEVLRLSLSAQDKEETREQLAEMLINQGRPGDARPLIEHVIEREIPDKIYLLAMMTDAHQARGEHAQALEMLDAVARIAPQVLKEKHFIKQRKLSKKHLATGKKIASKAGGAPVIQLGKVREAGSTVKTILAFALLLGMAGLYLGSAIYIGLNRQVWFVSGLDKPYTARMGDQAIRLTPYAIQSVHCSEGSINIAVEGEGVKIPPFNVEIKSNFWARPFAQKMFVINPDKLAVLHKEEIIYVAENRRDEFEGMEPERSYHFGQRFYQLGHVNYPFRDPERTIEVEGSKGTRIAVSALTRKNAHPSDLLGYLIAPEPPKRVIEFARAIVEQYPDNSGAVAAMQYLMESEAFMELARPELDKDPLQINWHRLYQEALEDSERKDELAAEYRKRAESKSDDPTMAYLLARALPSGEERTAAAERAANMPGAVPQALSLVCWDAARTGDFGRAADYGLKAVEAGAELPGFDDVLTDSLIGAERWQDLALHLDKQIAGGSVQAVVRKVYVMLVNEASDAEIEAAIKDGMKHLTAYDPEGRREIAKGITKFAKGFRLYDAGKFEEYVRFTTPKGEPPVIDTLLATGNAKAGLTAWTRDADPKMLKMNKEYAAAHAMEGLMIYVTARLGGDEESAASALEGAAGALALAVSEYRKPREWLIGESAPDAEAVRQMDMEPSEKRVLLAALIMRHPELRDACAPILEKFNFRRGYPQHLIKAVIENKPPERIELAAKRDKP